MIMSFFQRTRPEFEIESLYTIGRQRKYDCLNVDGGCPHCNTVFEPIGCFYQFSLSQELRPSLQKEDINRSSKKKKLNDLKHGYIQEIGFTFFET